MGAQLHIFHLYKIVGGEFKMLDLFLLHNFYRSGDSNRAQEKRNEVEKPPGCSYVA